MKVALFFRPHGVPGAGIRACLDVAKLADRTGLHAIHFGEHFIIGNRVDRYPYGHFGHDAETPWLDPITTFAAMAAVTERIRLSTAVVLAPLRPAPVLAKSVATLDALSDGRVELGVGTGWQVEEYAACGIPWSQRHARLDETIEACRALWGTQPASYAGRWTSFEGVHALPRPVQERVPVLYGVRMTETNAARIARLGDGWCPVGLSVDELRVGVGILRAAFDDAARDPATAIVRGRPEQPLDSRGRIDLRRVFAAAEREIEAGATVVTVGPPVGVDSLAGVTEFVEAVADAAVGHVVDV